MARITEVVSATDGLKTLSEALIVSGIDATLSADGPYTLFAPDEAAFTEIGEDVLVALAADPDNLAHILRSHVVAGRHTLSDLGNLERLESIDGTELYVSLGEDDETYVEEARVTCGDIESDNGVIHLIDLLILPPSSEVFIVDAAAGLADGNVVEMVAEPDTAPFFDYATDAENDQGDESVAV